MFLMISALFAGIFVAAWLAFDVLWPGAFN